MSRRTSASARERYGVRRVCKAWDISPATYYARKKKEERGDPPKRRGPKGVISDEDLDYAIREILKGSRFTAEGYRKIWARLRMGGDSDKQRESKKSYGEAQPASAFKERQTKGS